MALSNRVVVLSAGPYSGAIPTVLGSLGDDARDPSASFIDALKKETQAVRPVSICIFRTNGSKFSRLARIPIDTHCNGLPLVIISDVIRSTLDRPWELVRDC